MSNTNKLPGEQHEELLKVIKARFEKNMQRHPDLTWSDVFAKLNDNAAKLMCLDEWSERAANLMLYCMTTKPASMFFTIVPQKPQREGEVYVMTGKGRSQEKNTVPKIMP